jgi:hypothetical protein
MGRQKEAGVPIRTFQMTVGSGRRSIARKERWCSAPVRPVTKSNYASFEIQLTGKIDKGCNSGLLYHVWKHFHLLMKQDLNTN